MNLYAQVNGRITQNLFGYELSHNVLTKLLV
jgi:hypothetical protein